jgi:hypothetical protein
MERKLELVAVLPFKPQIETTRLTTKFKTMEKPVILEIDTTNKLVVVPGFKSIDTSHMLVIKFTMYITHTGDEASLYKRCSSDKIIWEALDHINAILLIIKYNDKNSIATKEIRSVGIIDLLFYQLTVDDKVYGNIGNSSFYAENKVFQTSINQTPTLPSNEWFTLVRSVELIERGYNSEGLLIGFSLLDSSVQDHLKKIMSAMASEESEELLSKITYDRLKIYLGPLHEALTGVSIIKKGNLAKELKWINTTRNNAIHNGRNCERSDATKGISLIIKIMKLLNEHGSSYELPDVLFTE